MEEGCLEENSGIRASSCGERIGIILAFVSKSLLWIRIRRIRMFLGLLGPDPDPLVQGTNPDPDPLFLMICDFFMTFYLWKIM